MTPEARLCLGKRSRVTGRREPQTERQKREVFCPALGERSDASHDESEEQTAFCDEPKRGEPTRLTSAKTPAPERAPSLLR